MKHSFHSRYLYLTIYRGYGGATITEPVGGFDDAALSTMFNPPSPTSTFSPDSHLQNKNKNNAYVAGVVIGAVTGIVMVMGLVAWILRRTRKVQRAFEMPGEATQSEDLRQKFRHSLVEVPPPTELHEDQLPAELQDERQDENAHTGPSELPG
jgi:H+/gluconate symporter-like permease